MLLVGNQWDGIRPTLTGLVSQGGIALIGPARGNVVQIASRTASSVIMVGPGVQYASLVALKKSGLRATGLSVCSGMYHSWIPGKG